MSDELVKIVFKEELKNALDHFSACFGIRIAYYSAAGDEVVVGLEQLGCGFCQIIRNDLKCKEQCLACDTKNRKIAKRNKQLHSYICHAGLNEAIKPLFVEGELIGYIMMGQFRTADKFDVKLLNGLDNSSKEVLGKLQQEFLKLPRIENEKLEHLEGLFNILVESTLKNNYYRIEGSMRILQVRQYLMDHINKPVTIKEVADHLSCSVSTLSHYVKKQQGISFKEFVIHHKLAKAFEYLKNSADATVKVAALSVGYEDQYYFSRIFKAYYGMSPSKIINAK